MSDFKKGIKLIRLLALGILTKKHKGKFQVVQLKVLKVHYWLMCTTLSGRVESQTKLNRWHRMEQKDSAKPQEGRWQSHHIIEPSFGRFASWSSWGVVLRIFCNHCFSFASLQWFWVFCFSCHNHNHTHTHTHTQKPCIASKSKSRKELSEYYISFLNISAH